MDEPTSSLTHHEVVRLLAIAQRLKGLGLAVVFVSHRLEEVVAIAERVTVLRDGRKVATLPATEVDHHRLAELMTGSRVNHTLKSQKPARGSSVMEDHLDQALPLPLFLTTTTYCSGPMAGRFWPKP